MPCNACGEKVELGDVLTQMIADAEESYNAEACECTPGSFFLASNNNLPKCCLVGASVVMTPGFRPGTVLSMVQEKYKLSSEDVALIITAFDSGYYNLGSATEHPRVEAAYHYGKQKSWSHVGAC